MNDMHNMQCIAYIYIRYFSNFAPVFCQGFKLRCTGYQVIEGGMKCWKISLECNYLFPDFWAACLLGERQERCNLLTRFLRNLIHAFLLFNILKSAGTEKQEGDKVISKRKRKRTSGEFDGGVNNPPRPPECPLCFNALPPPIKQDLPEQSSVATAPHLWDVQVKS